MSLNPQPPKLKHTSDEIRAYLESLIQISSEKVSVDDVLRGLIWDLRIVDPQARVVNVFREVRERMLKHGLTNENFSKKAFDSRDMQFDSTSAPE